MPILASILIRLLHSLFFLKLIHRLFQCLLEILRVGVHFGSGTVGLVARGDVRSLISCFLVTNYSHIARPRPSNPSLPKTERGRPASTRSRTSHQAPYFRLILRHISALLGYTLRLNIGVPSLTISLTASSTTPPNHLLLPPGNNPPASLRRPRPRHPFDSLLQNLLLLFYWADFVGVGNFRLVNTLVHIITIITQLPKLIMALCPDVKNRRVIMVLCDCPTIIILLCIKIICIFWVISHVVLSLRGTIDIVWWKRRDHFIRYELLTNPSQLSRHCTTPRHLRRPTNHCHRIPVMTTACIFLPLWTRSIIVKCNSGSFRRYKRDPGTPYAWLDGLPVHNRLWTRAHFLREVLQWGWLHARGLNDYSVLLKSVLLGLWHNIGLSRGDEAGSHRLKILHLPAARTPLS